MSWTRCSAKRQTSTKAILLAQQVTSNPHPFPLKKKKKEKEKKHILASDLKLHSGTVEANSIWGLTTEFPQK